MAIMHNNQLANANIVPADWVAGPQQGSWTYEAYAALPSDDVYEIVRGVLVMSPALEPEHQYISGEIHVLLYGQIKAKGRGQVFTAPIDVVLADDEVYQP